MMQFHLFKKNNSILKKLHILTMSLLPVCKNYSNMTWFFFPIKSSDTSGVKITANAKPSLSIFWKRIN